MENEFTRGHTHGHDSFSLRLYLFSSLSLSPALPVYFQFNHINNKGRS